MKNIRVDDLGGLKRALGDFGEKLLFRGQTVHFGTVEQPSATSSFDRQGCIPTEMLRWARYADEVLGAFTGRQADLALNQAILQHYGFRSFYLDCSDVAAVSAWFAGNAYSDRIELELSEDCDEYPLFLRKRMARYEPADGKGHLYVLDRNACERVGLTDLSTIAIAGARTRASVQHAYLLGPLRNAPLPIECYLGHIEGNCTVFRELAAEFGLATTRDVFPTSREDPILDTLLSLPWIEIPGMAAEKGDIPFFRRGLELPEYDNSFVKIASPTVAFYRGGKLDEIVDEVAGFPGGIGVQIPEVALFGRPDRGFRRAFPNVMALLKEHGGVIFEARTLIKFPQHSGSTVYQKGLVVDLVEPDLVRLSALMVEHPGQRIAAAGAERGWFHRLGADGIWRREPRKDDCPCGADWPHERHLESLFIVEDFLADRARSDEQGADDGI